MIRMAVEKDKEQIYKLWNDAFSSGESGYVDFYFAKQFKAENTYVIEEDGEIVATLQRNPHILSFNGQNINTSMILGVVTRSDKQNQGYMHELMARALEDCERHELITLIQCYDPNMYRPFGFSMEYYRTRTIYHQSQIRNYANLKTVNEFSNKELCEVYNDFVKHFDGYYVRNEGYFAELREEVEAEGGKIVGYRNANTNKLEGYMIYYLEKFNCDIKEIIYLNNWAFLAMMSKAAQTRIKVSVHTSDSEQILKIIPNGDVQTYPFCMARVNDYSVFNIVNDTVIQNGDEAFKIVKKPLFLHEYA